MQSPTNLDIEFIGNSANFQHLITNRRLKKEDLNFNLNLRNYKNTTTFNGQDPWLFPGPKEFSPKNQFVSLRETLNNRNNEFKTLFKDKKSEKNAGEIMHMVRRNDVYTNTAWMCGLRGDRDTKSKQLEKKLGTTLKAKQQTTN